MLRSTSPNLNPGHALRSVRLCSSAGGPRQVTIEVRDAAGAGSGNFLIIVEALP